MPRRRRLRLEAGVDTTGSLKSSRWRFSPRLGLRARITFTIGLGALALSTAMAGLTYFTARQFILHERETAILRQAYVNASLARSSLRSPNPDVTQLLDSLDTLPGSLSVMELRQQWYATSISVGENAIPGDMRTLVLGGTPANQLFALDGSPQMVVGVPLPGVDAAYFEVFSLAELERTLADPGPGPGGRCPRHHRGRSDHRTMGERPAAAPSGGGVRRGRDHRRGATRHAAWWRPTTPSCPPWRRRSTA